MSQIWDLVPFSDYGMLFMAVTMKMRGMRWRSSLLSENCGMFQGYVAND